MDGSVERMLDEVAAFRVAVVARVKQVNSLTEREVTEAGRSAIAIVERATAQAELTRRTAAQLSGSGAEAGIGQAIGRQTQLVEQFAWDLRERVGVQESLAEQAVRQLEAIGQAGEAVEGLALASRILALNARIEAAHLGVRGHSFEVIADEMKQLSNQVAETNRQIAELASRLGELLPQMVAQTHAVRERTEEFGAQVSSSIEDVHRGTERLGQVLHDSVQAADDTMVAILKDSQNAMSHLQFQDVVSQALLAIDLQAHALVTRVAGAASGDGVLPPAHTLLGGAESEFAPAGAGEVTLF